MVVTAAGHKAVFPDHPSIRDYTGVFPLISEDGMISIVGK